jgi:hypothetical protein
MEFVRKKKRGQNKRVRRSWYSKEGYRIIWRKEVHGVAVTPRYQACVRTVIPNYSGEEGHNYEMWEFVDYSRRLHKTMKAAQEACKRHHRLWSKACEATGLRALIGIFGRLPLGIPVWARKKMSHKALAVLTAPRSRKIAAKEEDEPCPTSSSSAGDVPSPSDPTSCSPTSESDNSSTAANRGARKTRKSGRASPASDGKKSATRKPRRARSKATQTDEPLFAETAKRPAKAPAKRARKRTGKRSAGGGKKRKSTAASSKGFHQESEA